MRSDRTVLCLLAVAIFFYGPAAAETLAEALADAYLTNPQLLAARARLRAVDENVPQALSNWRPTVSMNGNTQVQQQDRTLNGVNTSNTAWPAGLSLSLSQPLFRGLRTLSETERAEYQVLAERARLADAEQSVLLAVVTAYLNVVRDRAVVDLNASNVEVLRRQLEATEDRFRVGELTRTDVSQAQSRLQRAIADLVTARGALTSSIAAYVNVVGHGPGELEFPPPAANLPPSEESTIESARVDSPPVIAADYDERAAQSNVKLVEGELYPTVSLNASTAYNTDFGVHELDTFTETLTATANVPLYTAGSTYSRLRASKQTASQRRQDYLSTQRDAIETATRAWEALQTGLASVEAFEAEVRAQQIAYEGVQEEARVGARTTLDVLDAEQELFNAQVNLVRARRDATVASYSVFSAIGKLTAAALGLDVLIYNERDYYDRVRNRWFGAAIDR